MCDVSGGEDGEGVPDVQAGGGSIGQRILQEFAAIFPVIV